MIQIRFDVKYEDRFNIAYNDWLNRSNDHTQKEWLKKSINWIDKEEFIDRDGRFVSFTARISGKFLVNFMSFLSDTEDIMEIPIEFRYVEKLENAYDSGKDIWRIKWCKFSKL